MIKHCILFNVITHRSSELVIGVAAKVVAGSQTLDPWPGRAALDVRPTCGVRVQARRNTGYRLAALRERRVTCSLSVIKSVWSRLTTKNTHSTPRYHMCRSRIDFWGDLEIIMTRAEIEVTI